MSFSWVLRGVFVATFCLVASACGGPGTATDTDRTGADAAEKPALGACRVLTPEDVAVASNSTAVIDCAKPHTAQTYAVGDVPKRLRSVDYESDELGVFAYKTCSEAFAAFLGADESLVMRTVVSWAWFRPSPQEWEEGARWYRCDIVGGGEQSESYVNLPRDAQGLLQGRPADAWLVCADGETVAGSPKVPCSEEHDWRAVTTIKVGEAADPYPGDRLVEVTTRDFCSDSVGAWLNYPVDYDFGYTWFHEAEWEAGNRRSVCWAKTPD